jgi:hypothetical protein
MLAGLLHTPASHQLPSAPAPFSNSCIVSLDTYHWDDSSQSIDAVNAMPEKRQLRDLLANT